VPGATGDVETWWNEFVHGRTVGLEVGERFRCSRHGVSVVLGRSPPTREVSESSTHVGPARSTLCPKPWCKVSDIPGV
jgi:hypothetical protein